MAGKLWDILNEGKAPPFGSDHGYQPNRDPRIVPGDPDGEIDFVAKHKVADEEEPEEGDGKDPTKDDDLFRAKNIDRAVPGEADDRHGHVPTGKDASVYENVLAGRLFASAASKLTGALASDGAKRVGSAVVTGAARAADGVRRVATSAPVKAGVASAGDALRRSVADYAASGGGYVSQKVAAGIDSKRAPRKADGTPVGSNPTFSPVERAQLADYAKKLGRDMGDSDLIDHIRKSPEAARFNGVLRSYDRWKATQR